jgi:hypothetical protein
MKVEIYNINRLQFKSLLLHRDMPELTDLEAITLYDAAIQSEFLIAAFGDDRLLGFIGAKRLALLCDEAYIWFYHTKIAEKHPYIVARWSIKVINNLLSQYSTICGVCVNNESKRWLTWLGAVFLPTSDRTMPFIIGAKK